MKYFLKFNISIQITVFTVSADVVKVSQIMKF